MGDVEKARAAVQALRETWGLRKMAGGCGAYGNVIDAHLTALEDEIEAKARIGTPKAEKVAPPPPDKG